MYLKKSKTIVIKIGSTILIDEKRIIRKKWLAEFAKDIKDLLDQKGIKYTIIDSDKKFFWNLMQVTHSKKVPQIILNGEFVGDYNDLVEHFNGT